jgi:serine/threonine protein kinase
MPAEPRKYQIVREIGKGGMGTVYEVSHRVFQRRRAVKVLNPDLAGRKDLLDRFMKEAVRMARLQHPHIVMVHDIEEDEGFGTYIVMDLIDGQSLREMLKAGGPLPYLEVLRIGIEIASALSVAHRENIIHRDIKAQNILIEKATGKAVLTDFGIAKEMHREGEETVDGTATGVFIGTVRYACPEMFRMERAHPRWDVYAMGAVLYEALSGHIYLAELPQDKIPTRIAYDPSFQAQLDYPQPPPEDFERLVRDCLQRDAEQRIDSAATLLQRLEQCREIYLTVHKKKQTEEALRSLHGETEQDLAKLRAVQHQLADLDISSGDGTRAEEIEDRLREIGELEEADRHAEALGAPCSATTTSRAISCSVRWTRWRGAGAISPSAPARGSRAPSRPASTRCSPGCARRWRPASGTRSSRTWAMRRP